MAIFHMSLDTWKAIYLHNFHSILSFVCSCMYFLCWADEVAAVSCILKSFGVRVQSSSKTLQECTPLKCTMQAGIATIYG